MHAPLERLHEQLNIFKCKGLVQNVLIIPNQIPCLDSDKRNFHFRNSKKSTYIIHISFLMTFHSKFVPNV